MDLSLSPATSLAAEPTILEGVRGGTMRTEAVSAWFGRRQALADITLEMPAGAVTAIVGPSGCGKSTYLRLLNRMHELVPGAALAGNVYLDEVEIYGDAIHPTTTRLRVGMVFQKPNPFPSMSVRDNVLSGLRLAGVRRTDKDALAERCLNMAGLWKEVKDRLHEHAAGLSGGQQQRLCIARSLALQPGVLLMDEPCSALDPASTARIEETVRAIATEVTVVIVTHNLQQALRISDQTAFFLADENQPGTLIEAGATTDMFDHPADTRTEDYLRGRFG